MQDLLHRPHFTLGETDILVETAFEKFFCTEMGPKPEVAWLDMASLIQFKVSSSLGVAEIMALRQGDLEFAPQPGGDEHLWIHVPPVSRPEFPCFADPLAAQVGRQLMEQYGYDRGLHLFEPAIANREAALEFVTALFSVLLDDTGLHFDPQGRPRNLNSLVGTSLLFRAFGKTPFDQIAGDAGLSRRELDAFHDLHLASETGGEAL